LKKDQEKDKIGSKRDKTGSGQPAGGLKKNPRIQSPLGMMYSELAKLTHAVNQQTSVVTTAMTAMLKQLQSNPPPAQVKTVKEICATCRGAHLYYQCLTVDGNTFPEYQDNIQGYVSAATVNYNQGNPGYRPQGVANQMRPPGFAQPNVQNDQNRFGQPQGFNRGAASRWLKKDPSRSITTWDDLVSKFINELFPPSRTTNLRNEISNFQQKFDESFHEAWERYKDLLRAWQLIRKSPQDALTIIENKSKVRNSRNKPIASPVNACDNHSSSELAKLTHAVNQQTSAVTTAMTAMLKQFQSNPPLALVKAVEEICVTYGGAHPYYQCLAAGGNTFPEYRDNIQGYVSAATGNFNQGNLGYRPQGVANQMRPPDESEVLLSESELLLSELVSKLIAMISARQQQTPKQRNS
nr:hypothetical protein [Tanacetum cinerariifolium]